MKISIRQYVFSVREPFSEGTIITKAEAQALNGLRAENIRNNVSKWVADACQTGDGMPGNREDGLLGKQRLLTEQELTELQGRVTEYDLRYQFPHRTDKRDPVGLVELEIEQIARDRVESQVRQTGEAWSRFQYDKAVADALSDPQVQQEARRRVAARQQEAARALAELL